MGFIYTLLLALFAWFLPSTSFAFEPIDFDLEVAVCPEGTISLTELEFPILSPATPLNRPSDFANEFVAPMKALSPARAAVIQNFESVWWKKLQTISGISLRPRLPTTALFHRHDCSVRVVAQVTVDYKNLSGRLDADLWGSLTEETRNILLAESYFYFERTYWLQGAFGKTTIWDPTRTRFFLTRWLTPDSRPKDLAHFFSLAREADLAFVEQSGMIIPLQSPSAVPAVEWNQTTGWVKASYVGFDNSVWTTSLRFPSPSGLVQYSYAGWLQYEGIQKVLFRDDGSIHCLPWFSYSSRINYFYPVLGIDDEWKSDGYGKFQNLCLATDGSIESGYLVVPWKKEKTWNFESQTMTIRSDPLAGGTDQGTWVEFFPDKTIAKIDRSEGFVTVQRQKVFATGPMRFEKTNRNGHEINRLACARFEPGTRWRRADGSYFKIGTDREILCFDELENVVSSCRAWACFPSDRPY